MAARQTATRWIVIQMNGANGSGIGPWPHRNETNRAHHQPGLVAVGCAVADAGAGARYLPAASATIDRGVGAQPPNPAIALEAELLRRDNEDDTIGGGP